MRFQLKKMLAALGLAAGLLSPAMAQEPFQPTSMNHGRRDPIPVVPYAPADNCPAPAPGTMSPGTPGVAPAPNPNVPNPNVPNPNAPAPAPNMNAGDFGAAPSAGTGGGETYNPTMFGDLLAPSRINHGVFSTSFTVGSSTFTVTRNVVTPLAAAGSFKISDNGSPRPQDRAYFTYNYFNDVGTSVSLGNTYDVHRETFGFEKTFLDGNASLGLRLPFTESTGSGTGGLGDGTIGDLSLYGIYAFINDRDTGNVFSSGLVVTIPTGPSERDNFGHDYNTFIFQPFIGYIWNYDRSFFVQAFHSAILADHQSALSQDIALGWWAYRSNDSYSTVRGIVPTIELHLYTPLESTSSNGTIINDNILTVTTGATFMLGDRTTLGVAVGLPVTGPRPNSFEAITTLNWRF